MNKREILKTIAKVSETIAEELGLELVDLEFVKEFGSNFLRIYIDKPGGISLDDCQEVSEKVSEFLDEKDPIKDHYYLEVSSPGLDRPLKNDKDLKRNMGEEIEISLYQNLDGKKKYDGHLIGFDDKNLEIDSNNNKIVLPRELISLIKLKVNF